MDKYQHPEWPEIALVDGVLRKSGQPITSWERQGSRYRQVSIRGKDRYLHRVIMECLVGRRLRGREEEVHHLDSDPSNNHPANLHLTTPDEHRAIHAAQLGEQVVRAVRRYAEAGVAAAGIADRVGLEEHVIEWLLRSGVRAIPNASARTPRNTLSEEHIEEMRLRRATGEAAHTIAVDFERRGLTSWRAAMDAALGQTYRGTRATPLTEEQREEIAASDEPSKQVADAYGITPRYVRHLRQVRRAA